MGQQEVLTVHKFSVLSCYLACSATMFLSPAECRSYGDGIIKISPVFLSTSLGSSFFFFFFFSPLDFCFVC